MVAREGCRPSIGRQPSWWLRRAARSRLSTQNVDDRRYRPVIGIDLVIRSHQRRRLCSGKPGASCGRDQPRVGRREVEAHRMALPGQGDFRPALRIHQHKSGAPRPCAIGPMPSGHGRPFSRKQPATRTVAASVRPGDQRHAKTRRNEMGPCRRGNTHLGGKTQLQWTLQVRRDIAQLHAQGDAGNIHLHRRPPGWLPGQQVLQQVARAQRRPRAASREPAAPTSAWR